MFFNLAKFSLLPITIIVSFLLICVEAVGNTFASFNSDSIAIIFTPYFSRAPNVTRVFPIHSFGALTLTVLYLLSHKYLNYIRYEQVLPQHHIQVK